MFKKERAIAFAKAPPVVPPLAAAAKEGPSDLAAAPPVVMPLAAAAKEVAAAKLPQSQESVPAAQVTPVGRRGPVGFARARAQSPQLDALEGLNDSDQSDLEAPPKLRVQAAASKMAPVEPVTVIPDESGDWQDPIGQD